MQNLMDLDYGWSNLGNDFILKVVQILSSENSLINVCRPATAILKKLVEADPMSAPGSHQASSSKAPPTPPAGSVYRYGFEVVFDQMKKEEGLLETVVNRLGSADTTMALYRYSYTGCALDVMLMVALNSMMLINSLMAHVTESRWEELTSALQQLNVHKAVIV